MPVQISARLVGAAKVVCGSAWRVAICTAHRSTPPASMMVRTVGAACAGAAGDDLEAAVTLGVTWGSSSLARCAACTPQQPTHTPQQQRSLPSHEAANVPRQPRYRPSRDIRSHPLIHGRCHPAESPFRGASGQGAGVMLLLTRKRLVGS